MKAHIKKDLAPGPELEAFEISDILKHSKDIKNWLDSIEAYAMGKALAGEKWPGLKLVAGRSTRKIVDESSAAAALLASGYSDIYKPQTLRTITELEKLCGKKNFGEILGANIQKPKESRLSFLYRTNGRNWKSETSGMILRTIFRRPLWNPLFIRMIS